MLDVLGTRSRPLEVPDIARRNAGAERNRRARRFDDGCGAGGRLLQLEQDLPEARLSLLLETVRPKQIEQCLAVLGVALLERQIREQSLASAQRHRHGAPARVRQGETAEELKLHASRSLPRPKADCWLSLAEIARK
jgi:hypothetical protein